VSHRFVSDELTQLRAMASIPPVIFLTVAAFLLNVVLNRLISTQREQIAALKAFGYTKLEVGLHFLKLALLIVIVGTILGTATGAYLGRGLTAMYTKFFRFPVFAFSLEPGVVLLASLTSFTAGVLGVSDAVRRAMKLPPAEAMRPEPPTRYRATIFERIGLQRLLSHPARMILRQIERRSLRAALSSFSISMAVAVMVLGSFTRNIIDYVTDLQFNIAGRYDSGIAFVEPTSAHALHEVAHLPGVLRTEPYRTVPVRMRFGHRSGRRPRPT
jgi:putative ABC transport system permease protein